jgi:F-type H+-transporting ATPase subunit b
MADTPPNTASTQMPAGKTGGFPPFDYTTFPSQFFWLAVTFAFLFLVLWKIAGPRIKNAISLRRGAITGAITDADAARKAADDASAAYDAALAAARGRAQGMADETRRRIASEIAKAKAEAEAAAASAMSEADARITATRERARAHVAGTARDAAIAIVARLTGESVTAEEAAAAVGDGAVGG